MDTALKYLASHHEIANADEGATTTTSNLSALRRKIGWHIVPLAFLYYTMQFIDKVLLNVIDILFWPSMP
jgi:hypothetical protein